MVMKLLLRVLWLLLLLGICLSCTGNSGAEAAEARMTTAVCVLA